MQASIHSKCNYHRLSPNVTRSDLILTIAMKDIRYSDAMIIVLRSCFSKCTEKNIQTSKQSFFR